MMSSSDCSLVDVPNKEAWLLRGAEPGNEGRAALWLPLDEWAEGLAPVGCPRSGVSGVAGGGGSCVAAGRAEPRGAAGGRLRGVLGGRLPGAGIGKLESEVRTVLAGLGAPSPVGDRVRCGSTLRAALRAGGRVEGTLRC